MRKTYHVEGMTCDHCKKAVEQEVGAVAGAQTVDADPATGIVVVTGEDLSDADVAAAITEAGYTLVR